MYPVTAVRDLSYTLIKKRQTMKTIRKPICLLMAAACLCACSKDKDGALPDGAADIVLSAGIPTASVQSKAPVNSGDKFSPSVAGWESSSAVNYAVAPTWQTTTSEITASATTQAVTLTDGQVYSADKTIKTYMKAWYPQGTLADGQVTFTGDASYKGDGTDDVLLAGEVSGSKIDRANKVLAFGHMATQLKFVVIEGEGLSADTKLMKIELKNVEVPGGINLVTNALTGTAKEALSVPDIDGSLVIGTTEAGDAAGSPLMIVPPVGNTVTMKVTTSTAVFDNITATIDTDENFVAGKAYTIALTFNQQKVDLNATLADWSAGTGSGTVI